MKTVSIFKVLKGSKGSTSVIFICSVFIIILLSALVTDIGYIAFERYKLSRSVDSIVMSGAEALTDSREKCIELIKNNVAKSINDIKDMDVRISDNNREISLYVTKDIGYIFLRYIGFNDKQIESRVTAKLSNVTSFKGIRPFAVEREDLLFGKQYYLTTSKAISGESGDIRVRRLIPLDIGNESFETALIYGYRKKVNIGNVIHSYTDNSFKIDGNSFAELIKRCKHDPPCTFENHVDGCSRIIVLPVVEKNDSSESNSMKVIGFTTFFIEDGNRQENNEGSIALKGRFIRYTVNAMTSDGMPDFGLLGVKLIH